MSDTGNQKYSYDSECEELAKHFLELSGSNSESQSLAQHIQDAVENWYAGKENR